MSDFAMGLLTLDYFECEAFELNFRLYVFGGFWPLNTNIKWKKILFSIFSFLCYFSLVSMIFIQIVDLYLLRNNPVGLTKDLCSISIAYTIVIKSILILYNVNEINDLKEEFVRFKNGRTDPVDIEILEDSNKKISFISRVYFLLTVPCVVFWLLFPGLDSSDNKQVPFPYKLPIEEWTFPVYIGVYVYHAFAMVGYLFNTVAVDTIFCGFVLRINAHYDIIIKNIKKLGDFHDSERDKEAEREVELKNVKKILTNSVELHQEILRHIKTFEEVFYFSNIVHFIGVVTIIGTAIIDFIRVAKGFKLQLLQKLLYVAVVLWDAFTYCFFAGKVQEKSMELSLAAYGIQWYNMKPEIRRDILFICYKSQKAPKIKVAHLFFLNLSTFVRLMKISYDITALLFQAVRD